MTARADVTGGRTWRDIAALFRAGQPAELTAFIQSCPDFPMRDQAVALAGQDMPGARSLALGIVGQGLAFGRAAAFGAEVELAAHALLREDFDRCRSGSRVSPRCTSWAASTKPRRQSRANARVASHRWRRSSSTGWIGWSPQ